MTKSAKDISKALQRLQQEREQNFLADTAGGEVTKKFPGHTVGNMYTTTLHGINSAIIKLGKLTVAEKVYRGIAGMKLKDKLAARSTKNSAGCVVA